MNKIKILTILLVSSVLLFSCKQDEVEFTEAGPTAGFADADLEVTGTYSDQTTHTVSTGINMFNNNGAAFTVNFSIDETTVDAAIEDAVALVQESVSVSNAETDIDIVTVDFSEVVAGASDVEYSFDVLISATDLKIGSVEKTVTVKVIKERLPRVVLDGTTHDYKVAVGSTATGEQNYDVTIEIFDKAVEENVTIPFELAGGGIYGTEFTMDTVLTVTSGNTSWSGTLTVDIDEFAHDENISFYLEAYEANMPANIVFVDYEDYWTGFSVGRVWDWIWLNKGATYSVTIDSTETGTVHVSVDVPFNEANDKAFEQDFELPIVLSDGTATIGTEILYPETIADVGTSSMTWTMNFVVDASLFTKGETKNFYVELYDANVQPLYQNVRVDDYFGNAWWWTTVAVTKGGTAPTP